MHAEFRPHGDGGERVGAISLKVVAMRRHLYQYSVRAVHSDLRCRRCKRSKASLEYLPGRGLYRGTALGAYLSSPSQFHIDDKGKVLGHILAHEICHVLEGVARHSDSGSRCPRAPCLADLPAPLGVRHPQETR